MWYAMRHGELKATFNRTIIELKPITARAAMQENPAPFNRTIIELKLAKRTSIARPCTLLIGLS